MLKEAKHNALRDDNALSQEKFVKRKRRGWNCAYANRKGIRKKVTAVIDSNDIFAPRATAREGVIDIPGHECAHLAHIQLSDQFLMHFFCHDILSVYKVSGNNTITSRAQMYSESILSLCESRNN